MSIKPGELYAMAVERAQQAKSDNESRGYFLPDADYERMGKEILRVTLRQTRQECPACGWRPR